MEFIESLERMTLADKFRKYHPGATVSKKGHYKEWLFIRFHCHKMILSVLVSLTFSHSQLYGSSQLVTAYSNFTPVPD